MNKHIDIISLKSNAPNGLIIKFKDENKNKYHTYLDNAETAQLATELNEILCFNLYQIKKKE